MTKGIVKVAPYDNEEAREEAEFICHGVADEKEIQTAINVASVAKRDVLLEPGTYRISKGIRVKGVNVSGPTIKEYTIELPDRTLDAIAAGAKLAEEVKSEIKEEFTRIVLEAKEYPIPEEFQAKVREMVKLVDEANKEVRGDTFENRGIKKSCLREFKVRLCSDICTVLGVLASDCPTWSFSENGKKLIGYRYNFIEEVNNARATK